jgi:hypothetical protein
MGYHYCIHRSSISSSCHHYSAPHSCAHTTPKEAPIAQQHRPRRQDHRGNTYSLCQFSLQILLNLPRSNVLRSSDEEHYKVPADKSNRGMVNRHTILRRVFLELAEPHLRRGLGRDDDRNDRREILEVVSPPLFTLRRIGHERK